MTKPLISALAALSLAACYSTAFARSPDDGVLVDRHGHAEDLIVQRLDLRGHGQDAILKRAGADNVGIDLRGRAHDLLPKRQGADDPVNHIRRGQGADDVGHMQHARTHR
jgi:hypothetical protein